MGDEQSFASWTQVPSTIATESMVQVPSSSSNTRDDDAACCLDLTVLARNDSVGKNSSETTTHICANIKAVDAFDDTDDDSTRASVDIVVALDISGSMQTGNKLKNCKNTLEMIVRTLKSTDRFAIITFSDQAVVALPACAMTQKNKEVSLQKISSIVAAGCTNLSGGLSLAAQEVSMIQDPNGVQSILLLTDGHANVGITDTHLLRNMVKGFTCRDETRIPPGLDGVNELKLTDDLSVGSSSLGTKPSNVMFNTDRAPISLLCFGYGSDHNSTMLEAIANETPGGLYYFVEHGSDSNISSALGDAIGGLLSVVAQSAVLTISLPPFATEKGMKILNVHHKEAIQRSDGVFTVNVGDFYSEESRDVLFEVQLANLADDNPVPHALVRLSYTDAIRGKNCSRGPISCSIARPNSDYVSPSNPHVETQLLRIRTVDEINAARREADSNNLSAARERLERSIQNLRSPNMQGDMCQRSSMAQDMEEILSGLGSVDAYRTVGSHKMTDRVYTHTMQRGQGSLRADESSSEGKALYATKRKRAMKAAFKNK